MKGVIISLYDYSGVMCAPYEANLWACYKIDIQRGQDILNFDYKAIYTHYGNVTYGLIIAQPCDVYANSGQKYQKFRVDLFKYHQKLVAKTKEIVDFYSSKDLKFWVLENPMTTIHKHNPWIGNVIQVIQPYELAGYSSTPHLEGYKKTTWLFGKFNKIEKLKPVPITFNKVHSVGGSSLRTKNIRSETPEGIANAFYLYNH